MCLDIYPLVKTAIREAPSIKAKDYLRNLKAQVEQEFKIPSRIKLMQSVVPALALYTKLTNTLVPHPQPKSEIHRYRFTR